VEHACASRHGDAPAAGIAASRRSRRYPKRLRLCMRGLRWPAASCLAGPALQPQMLAAWRRPSRGAPTGPRCPGRMCSGRPYEAADTCCGRARAQRPSGEHGFRGVARVFSLRGERGEKSFFRERKSRNIIFSAFSQLYNGVLRTGCAASAPTNARSALRTHTYTCVHSASHFKALARSVRHMHRGS